MTVNTITTKQTRRSRWTPEQREKALQAIRETGSIREASRQTGVPKMTLSDWAKDDGIDLAARARERTAAANDVTRATGAEARAALIEKLEAQALDAAETIGTAMRYTRELSHALADLDVVTLTDPDTGRVSVEFDGDAADTARAAVAKVTALTTLPIPMRDIVGIQTRAIHDIALLSGDPTERTQTQVVFAVPRPRPLDPSEVVTLDPADIVGEVAPNPDGV